MLITAVLPVLAQIKFSSLSRARDIAKIEVEKEKKKAVKKKEQEKEKSKDKSKKKEETEGEEEKDEELAIPKDNTLFADPSTIVLLLLLAAEVCEYTKLLDPKSGMSKRAIEELAKLHKRNPQGFIQVIDAFASAVEKSATFAMVRFIAAMA